MAKNVAQTITQADIMTVKVTEKMRKVADEIAKKKIEHIYNRYNYTKNMRLNKIFIGELGSQAVREFIDSLKLEYVWYDDIRTDDYKYEDPYDFAFGSTKGDSKCSRDNREHGLKGILETHNLVTPTDQSVKDVIIQAFVEKTEGCVWIVAWATRKDLKKPKNVGSLPQQSGKYYKMQIQTCRKIRELKKYLLSLGAKPL